MDTGSEHHGGGFLTFFRNLPEKSSTTIRIFNRTDYYTVHGDDAIFAAKEFFKTLSVVKYYGAAKDKIAFVNISKQNFEVFVKDLLLVRHYRIELYQSKGTGKNSDEWTVECRASPGNLSQFEDLLFSNNEITSQMGIMAIKLESDKGKQVFGIAFVNSTNQNILVCEFVDNDQFSNLEALTVQLSPKECLIASGEQDFAKLQQIMERNSVLVTDRKKGEFNSKDIVQDLNRLLKFKKGQQRNCVAFAEIDLTAAMSALSVLIKYLELLSDESNFNRYSIKKFDSSQLVRLDAAAVKALNLIPGPYDGNKTHNVLGLLNKCRTFQGQRLLAQWIMKPLTDRNKIGERHDVVEALVNDIELRQVLYDDHLRKIPDLHKLVKRFHKKRATLQDCYKIYQMLEKLPNLLGSLNKFDGSYKHVFKEKFNDPLNELLMDFNKFQQMIDTTLDLEQVENNEFLIKPDFDENLGKLHEDMVKLEKSIKGLLDKVATDLGLEANKTVKLESNSQLGYFFRITRKEETALRNNKNYRMIDTNKNGVRFNNTQLRDLNDEYVATRNSYTEVQQSVVSEILKIAAEYSEPMLNLSDVLAELDVLVAFAVSAVSAPVPYIRPTMLDKESKILRLKQARHPCVEMQPEVTFIPNDVNFEKDKEMFHIITGPNMGGKSTYIRSIGVIVVMAQLGSFVPCKEAEISVVDAVLARVGAGDCQLKGVSTFMAEMLETAAILRSSTEHSLIVIDELGRGTSTYDGFGLAWAISHHIATKIKAYCLFASHFHELTALAEEVPNVNNLHVTALTSDNTLTLLYRVKPGVCDQSFGIHVAEMVQFPPVVIKNAKRKVSEFEDFPQEALAGTELEGTDEAAVKRRRLVKLEGEKLIKEFLENVKELQLSEKPPEEALSAINNLKVDLLGKNNLFVNFLLQRSS